MPEEKRDLIQNKYQEEIKKISSGLGVILVKESGYYDFLIKAFRKDSDEIILNQELLHLALNS